MATRRSTLVPFVLFAVVGCATVPSHDQPVRPHRHVAIHGQLVVHSDFKLPERHRLMDELQAQRDDLAELLALPTSDEPINVYLFENSEEFGSFIRARYPLLPSRRAFFVETDTRLAVYAHWGDYVAEDLRHEVAHGYLHSVVPRLPLWLDEGLAEYFEVARGQHGVNRAHVAELKHRVLTSDWRPDLQRLEQFVTIDQMTQLDYAESWVWVHLMLESSPVTKSFLQDYLNRLRDDGIAEPMSHTIHTVMPQATDLVVAHLARLAD